jgi:hypothetical protein
MTADKLLDTAARYLGVKEAPPDSNRVLFNTDYYGREVSGSAYPWCCVFIWYIFREAGATDLFFGGEKTASCTTLYDYYRGQGQMVPVSQARPGDLVFFVFDGNTKGIMNHIGIVENTKGGYITTIDGNTGTVSEANGGAVMRRTRAVGYVGGVARPNYQEEDEMTQEQFNAFYDAVNPIYNTVEDVPDYWKDETKALIDSGKLKGTGEGKLNIRHETLRAVIIGER